MFGPLQSDADRPELGVSSAGEIPHKPEDEPACYESDFENEIQTETAQSAEEISEHLSGGNEHSFEASEPPSLSAKSNSNEDYTLSEKPSKATSVHYSRSESCLSHSRSSDTPAYTSDTTHTHTSPQSPSVRRLKKDATVQTKAEGFSYMWSSGRSSVVPLN